MAKTRVRITSPTVSNLESILERGCVKIKTNSDRALPHSAVANSEKKGSTLAVRRVRLHAQKKLENAG